jgi:hypothetical protein
MTIKLSPSYAINPTIHVCSICERSFTWNSESAWFGILEDKRSETEIIEKVCSWECRQKSSHCSIKLF